MENLADTGSTGLYDHIKVSLGHPSGKVEYTVGQDRLCFRAEVWNGDKERNEGLQHVSSFSS